MTLTSPEQKERHQSPRLHKLSLWQGMQDRTPLGWLQLKKNKGRLLVAVAGIGFADLLMFAQLGIQAALFDSNTLLNRGMDADIVLRSAQYRDLNLANTLPRRRLYQVKDVPGVQSAEPLYVSRVVWKNPQTRRKNSAHVGGSKSGSSSFDLR